MPVFKQCLRMYQISNSNKAKPITTDSRTFRGIGNLSENEASAIFKFEAMVIIIAKDPRTIAKIKDRSFSTLRISYSTFFVIFSCSTIAMLEMVDRSSFVINFTFGLFEQTTDFKLLTSVV